MRPINGYVIRSNSSVTMKPLRLNNKLFLSESIKNLNSIYEQNEPPYVNDEFLHTYVFIVTYCIRLSVKYKKLIDNEILVIKKVLWLNKFAFQSYETDSN